MRMLQTVQCAERNVIGMRKGGHYFICIALIFCWATK